MSFVVKRQNWFFARILVWFAFFLIDWVCSKLIVHIGYFKTCWLARWHKKLHINSCNFFFVFISRTDWLLTSSQGWHMEVVTDGEQGTGSLHGLITFCYYGDWCSSFTVPGNNYSKVSPV